MKILQDHALETNSRYDTSLIVISEIFLKKIKKSRSKNLFLQNFPSLRLYFNC